MIIKQNQYGWWQLQITDDEAAQYPDMFIKQSNSDDDRWNLSAGLERQLENCEIFFSRVVVELSGYDRQNGFQFASKDLSKIDFLRLRLSC